jgi:hypothetical protein
VVMAPSLLVERAAIERPQSVEDVVQRHERTGLGQLAPVRKVLHRAGIRGPRGKDCSLLTGVKAGCATTSCGSLNERVFDSSASPRS